MESAGRRTASRSLPPIPPVAAPSTVPVTPSRSSVTLRSAGQLGQVSTSSSGFTFSLRTHSGATSPKNNVTTQPRNPTASLSPLPSVESRPSTEILTPTSSAPGSPGSQHSAIQSLGDGLGNVCLDSQGPGGDDSLNMGSVAAALETAAITPASRPQYGPSLSPVTPAGPGRLSLSPSPAGGRQARNPPHRVEDEELPGDPFHAPEFQAAFGEALSLMSGLVPVLGSSLLHTEPDSTMRRLHTEAQALADFRCPSTRVVGFVGESGVGKSSLLNSLLDFRMLARTSNGGEACTCVATEYHFHDSEQFVIELDRFTVDEIMEQLAELLENYRHHHLSDGPSDDITEADDQEAAFVRAHFEERERIAMDTFQAMFRGRGLDRDSLLRRTTDEILAQFRGWVQDSISEARGRREVVSTLAECSDLLMRLSSDQNSGQEPADWPFIRNIKVFTNAPILRHGLVLVDLPGLRDTNTARRNITERYMLLRCDEIFSICQIGRASTDEGVWEVFHLAEQAGLSRVGIVCTRSDDICAEEAQNDWQDERRTRIRDLEHVLNIARINLARISEELEELEEFDDDELSRSERLQRRTLRVRKREAERDRSNAEFSLKEYLVRTRNEEVTRRLQDKYGVQMRDNQLDVFCVSNQDYWEHRDKPADRSLRYLRLSGILDVRRHCISIVSASQLRAVTKYIRDDIPALVGEIGLWVLSGSGSAGAEQKERITRALNRVDDKLERDLKGHNSPARALQRLLKQEFRSRIFSNTTTSAQQLRDWKSSGLRASKVWEQWAPSTYSAFCRNYGNHTTGAAGWHDWNEQIIHHMVGDLNQPWAMLCLTVVNRQETTLNQLTAVMISADEEIRNELEGIQQATVEVLSEVLDSRNRLLERDVEGIYEVFETALERLRIDVLSSVRTSLIGQAMEPAYRECNFEGGSGSNGRRHAIVRSVVSHDALFSGMMRAFRGQFDRLAAGMEAAVRAAVATHVDAVRGTLDMIRSENVARESERDPGLRARVENAVASAREVMGDLALRVGAV